MMVKAAANEFGCIGHVSSGLLFNLAKSPSMTLSFTSTLWSIISSMIPPMASSIEQKGWEGEVCHQWEAHLHLPGVRSHEYQTDWCWGSKCCGVHCCLHYPREFWCSPEGSQQGHPLFSFRWCDSMSMMGVNHEKCYQLPQDFQQSLMHHRLLSHLSQSHPSWLWHYRGTHNHSSRHHCHSEGCGETFCETVARRPWGAQNIVLASSGTSKAMDTVISELNEKFIHTAFHVPTWQCVSCGYNLPSEESCQISHKKVVRGWHFHTVGWAATWDVCIPYWSACDQVLPPFDPVSC